MEQIKKERIRSLDTLRGAAILLMVLQHGTFNYYFVFGGKFDLYTWSLPIGIVVASLFFVLSGISCHLSRSNLKRGLIAFLFALSISAVTYLTDPNLFIAFGVLHALSLSMIIYSFTSSRTDRLFGNPTPLIYFILFVVSLIIVKTAPPVSNPYLFIFGFPSPGFHSADYYPLFPWILMFFFGASIANLVIEKRLPPKFYAIKSKPLEWIGRHGLAIYIIHQPILFALFMLVQKLTV